MTIPVERIKEKYNYIVQQPFPHQPADDAWDGVFAELVEYDGFVAGIVATYLDGKLVDKNWLEDQGDSVLLHKIDKLWQMNKSEWATKQAIRNYAVLLHELMDVLRASLV